MLVLVGDLEPEYAEVIEEVMRCRSHRVVVAASRESFLRFFDRSPVDLIVMSSALAEGPADLLVAQLHCSQPAPIVVTFEEGQAPEMAACFHAGADDCIRKPFHPGEFAARIDAITRPRFTGLDEEQERRDARGLRFTTSIGPRGMEFDDDAHRAYVDGVDVRCSRLEYDILRTIAEMDGAVLPYPLLNQRIWGYSGLADATMLKGHIGSIRAKLRAAGAGDDVIRTVNGVGYALAPTEDFMGSGERRGGDVAF